jgi:small-conductance mechanosensitive channel
MSLQGAADGCFYHVRTARAIVVEIALKIAGAIVLYIVGRWLIGLVGMLIPRALERQKIEPTAVRYIGSTINVALNKLPVIGILGYFGVETTSFAALIAALGIAIGAASGGSLSNVAVGVFILVLRPLKVGNYEPGGKVGDTVPAARPCVHANHYWLAHFDTSKAIRDTLVRVGNPVAEAYMRTRGA